MDERQSQIDEALLRLVLTPGIGPRLCRQLIEHFGSADAAASADSGRLRQVPGIGRKSAEQIAAALREVDVRRQLELCRTHGIRIVSLSDAEYPRLLREIPDPPPLLFVRGELLPSDELAIAIVGTRHATPYGLQQAERLAAGLAQAGLAVVSGMARGIDAAAHRGAMLGGGRTIAVLASGLANIYPPEHAALAEQIVRRGALVSEAPPQRLPRSGVFPQRNRLITGMSLGVIVVEAAARSGALISARHAAEQGREVFAVPGRIDSRVSRGCHQLIRDGATLVESVDDVLDQLGPLIQPTRDREGHVVHQPAELRLNDQERQVLEAIHADPTPIDAVIARSGLPPQRVLATISVLEMRRLIRRVSGTQVVRR